MMFEMMEPCQIMNRIRTDDDYGSESVEWLDGTTFDAAVIKDTTTEAIVAEKQGVKEIYRVVTQKGFVLSYNDYFKRLSDNQLFRVTSNSKDSEAPNRSTVKIAKVTAEKAVYE